MSVRTLIFKMVNFSCTWTNALVCISFNNVLTGVILLAMAFPGYFLW